MQAADSGAVLAPPRILRRIIKYDRKLTGLGLEVPHRKSFTIGREALLAIAGRRELGLDANRQLPETVLLIARPDEERLASRPRASELAKYWRLLFHARVHAVLEQRRAVYSFGPALFARAGFSTDLTRMRYC